MRDISLVLLVFVSFLLNLGTTAQAQNKALAQKYIQVCSFNIQFLGTFEQRDHEGLAKLMRSEKCDLAVIQEIIIAPAYDILKKNDLYQFENYDGDIPPNVNPRVRDFIKKRMAQYGVEMLQYPVTQLEADPVPIIPNKVTTEFFEKMLDPKIGGFSNFILSEDNTGVKAHRRNTNSSEWFAVFYDANRIKAAPDLPHGFVSEQLVGEKRDYRRTPYAFPFRSLDDKIDFVLISVHLAADDGGNMKAERKKELESIRSWTQNVGENEKDFIILGDMNINDPAEIQYLNSWPSLNQACEVTNVLVWSKEEKAKKPKKATPGRCYDHAMMDTHFTTDAEVPLEVKDKKTGKAVPNFEVIDIKEKMRARWEELHPGKAYPGGTRQTDGTYIGYDNNVFRTTYSDHDLVKFKIRIPQQDDDDSREESPATQSLEKEKVPQYLFN